MKYAEQEVWLSWWIWVFSVSFSSGQNLVPNSDFDQFEICPPYPGQVHLALPWDSPNNKTTDFYHRCADESSSASVPGNFQSDDAMVREERAPGERPSVYYYLDAVFVEPCPEPPSHELTRDTQLCRGQSIKITLDSTAWTANWSDGSRSLERIFAEPGTYQVSLDFGCYQQTITYQFTELGCDCSFRQRGPNASQSQWPLELVRSEIRLFDARGQYLGAFSRESLEAFAKNLPTGLYFFDMQLTCATAARETYRQTGSFIIVTQ